MRYYYAMQAVYGKENLDRAIEVAGEMKSFYYKSQLKKI